MPVHPDDDVARQQSGVLGGALLLDANHHRARHARKLQALGHLTRHRFQLGAKPGPFDLAARDGALDDQLHEVGGNCEADAVRAARAREDRRVDADHLAGHVDQRAAGVAGIDGRIRLNENLRVRARDARAAQRRDDAARHRLADAERIADGEHLISHLDGIGIRKLQERETARTGFHAQHGDVGTLVLQQYLRVELPSVGQNQPDLRGAGHLQHVRVGYDQPVSGQDDAGAQRALRALLRHAEPLAVELAEVLRVAAARSWRDLTAHIDVHDRGGGLLHHAGE